VDLLEGFRSYGDLNLGVRVPQKIAPLVAKLHLGCKYV